MLARVFQSPGTAAVLPFVRMALLCASSHSDGEGGDDVICMNNRDLTMCSLFYGIRHYFVTVNVNSLQ